MRPVYAAASVLLFTLAFLSGCGAKKVPRTQTPARVQTPARIGTTQVGIASWYGIPFDGRKTSSGEIFDMRKLTAAHRTLPFDTWVEVTNLSNGKRIDVRITDRGPFVDGRIIDLSLGAAREIDMVTQGIVKVRLKVIPPPKK
jgi:rare lipoprotein A